MNRSRILGIAGVAAMLIAALALRSCTSDSVPVGPGGNGIGASGAKIDSALERLDPQFTITPGNDNSYRLGMTVGAGGSPDSPGMKALRTIQAVQFEMYTPERRLIATERSDDVPTSGVRNSETGEESIIASAFVRYTPSVVLPSGTYGVMTVIGTNGIATRRMTFPERPFVP